VKPSTTICSIETVSGSGFYSLHAGISVLLGDVGSWWKMTFTLESRFYKISSVYITMNAPFSARNKYYRPVRKSELKIILDYERCDEQAIGMSDLPFVWYTLLKKGRPTLVSFVRPTCPMLQRSTARTRLNTLELVRASERQTQS